MAEPAVHGDREVMLKDHTATVDLYKILVDIRFKLLTFVPTVTTIAVGILSLDRQRTSFAQGTTLLVGVAGVIVSTAIVVYEIRNSQIHDRAIHRIKHLETLLGFTPSYAAKSPRGMFQERGEGEVFLGLFVVQHDRALAMVYGVVLTLWSWVLLTGLGDFVGWFDGPNAWPGAKVAVSAGVGLVVASEISRQGGVGREAAVIYTLADILSAGKPRVCSDMDRGGRIWAALKGVRTFVNNSVNAKNRTSLEDLIRTTGANSSSCCGVNAEELVALAIASGVVRVRQRSLPPWSPGRGKRRKEALRVEMGSVPSPAALTKAIVGAQDVFEFLVQKQEACGRRNDLQAKDLALVQAGMMQRYGLKAPWCSDEEICLRWELLTAARNEPAVTRK